MSTQPVGYIPEWTLGDRCRKARESAGYSQQELADAMGVARNTVGNYELDASERPRKVVLKAWALATGVSAEWLETGSAPNNGGDPIPAGIGRPALVLLAA